MAVVLSRYWGPIILGLSLFWASLLSLAQSTPVKSESPEFVTVGTYIHDIQNLDIKTHSYALDFSVWFKWRDSRLNPHETLEFANAYELWGHVKSFTYPKPIRLPTGELYQVLRVQGRFSQKFDLSNYPFDRQILTIEFDDRNRESNLLTYKLDTRPLAVNPDLNLPGFRILEPSTGIRSAYFPTVFGDTRQANATGSTYSRVLVEVPIKRPTLGYAIKFLVPILSVVLCAGLIFLFNPSYVDSRVGTGITALLTIVALQITLNEDLPEIDYLVLIDKIYLGAFIYVIAGLALVVKTTWMMESNSSGRTMAIKISKYSLILLTLLYLIYVIWITYPII